jgi:hypothetical protein
MSCDELRGKIRELPRLSAVASAPVILLPPRLARFLEPAAARNALARVLSEPSWLQSCPGRWRAKARGFR